MCMLHCLSLVRDSPPSPPPPPKKKGISNIPSYLTF
ncbi:unnamed protein product [Phytomonas sp. EM1]|nr:unnamed protein product [Phytomonas sp. EM1]|eukprot:CCW65353.1 unnamed protein product [Phytomonas sp. isolate EM1]